MLCRKTWDGGELFCSDSCHALKDNVYSLQHWIAYWAVGEYFHTLNLIRSNEGAKVGNIPQLSTLRRSTASSA